MLLVVTMDLTDLICTEHFRLGSVVSRAYLYWVVSCEVPVDPLQWKITQKC